MDANEITKIVEGLSRLAYAGIDSEYVEAFSAIANTHRAFSSHLLAFAYTVIFSFANMKYSDERNEHIVNECRKIYEFISNSLEYKNLEFPEFFVMKGYFEEHLKKNDLKDKF